MTHWIIAPIVLPALLAPFIVLAARYHIGIQRAFSVAGVIALIAIASGLAWQTSDGSIVLYQLSDWAAPFGIVLVGDRLSTMMVLLTTVLALFVLLYAIGSGWDARGWHFHALFQFQLMGIMGAFLTGDLFNLFVFFEVLLIASYGLMIHAGGNARLRAGVQYVLFNLIGSTLFLFALGSIYAETGTLNMADLANRVAMIGPEDTVGIRVAAVLLLVPKTRHLGAVLGLALLTGAIFFHVATPLGIAVTFPGSETGDPTLFVMAVIAWLCCAATLYMNRERFVRD